MFWLCSAFFATFCSNFVLSWSIFYVTSKSPSVIKYKPSIGVTPSLKTTWPRMKIFGFIYIDIFSITFALRVLKILKLWKNVTTSLSFFFVSCLMVQLKSLRCRPANFVCFEHWIVAARPSLFIKASSPKLQPSESLATSLNLETSIWLASFGLTMLNIWSWIVLLFY